MDISKHELIVIKVGTNVIVDGEDFDKYFFTELISEVTNLVKQNKKVLIVTSGAIGFGKKRISCVGETIVEQQGLAAIGQALLMNEYIKRFDSYGIETAQVLLSQQDLLNKECFSNIKNTFNFLFQKGVVAIVNENDVVATSELRKNGVFSDNDSLASLLAVSLNADLLVMLTKTNGLIGKNGEILDNFSKVSDLLDLKTKSSGGRGGIDSKINAILSASRAGCDVFVSGSSGFSGFSSGKAVGTLTNSYSFISKDSFGGERGKY
jgi:glutamate 5-kinase